MIEWPRIMISILCISAVIMIIIVNHPKRRELAWHYVLSRIGLGAILISTAYGVIDAGMDGVPVTTRLWLLFAALIWLNVGVAVEIIVGNKHRKRRMAAQQELDGLNAQLGGMRQAPDDPYPGPSSAN